MGLNLKDEGLERDQSIPYWNMNMPKEQWTAECPAFLQNLPDGDCNVLGTRDDAYHRMTWEEVREVIRLNRLELFNRYPSDLRRYRAYISKIKQSHGSVMKFILQERVKWDDLTPAGRPFERPDDLKILYNDWPYGIDSKIVHLVVWTKFDLAEEGTTGDLTPNARRETDDYVNATFKSENPSHIIWFKNWASLKSVHAVEHFHVMLYDPDPAFVRSITNGDVPMASKV